MHYRCSDPACPKYPDYGGRGITVCERWSSLDAFLQDMGPRPKNRTLERINNDGNYEPDNCRWATMEDQLRNTRRNVKVIIEGEELLQVDALKRVGVTLAGVHKRMRTKGETLQQAFDHFVAYRIPRVRR